MILEWIEELRGLLNILSWTKVIQIFLISLISVGVFVLWEGRAVIFQYYEANRPVRTIVLSKKSIRDIDTFTRTNYNIVGTQITSVDFQKNIRKVVFASIDDDRMKRIYDRFLDDIKITEFPFLSNNDQQNNIRMVGLLNGEFVCNPYLDTLAGHVMPEGAVIVTTVCATGIPPDYGKFMGIITVYLKHEPVGEEKLALQTFIRDLASHIYKNDIE